MNKNIKKKTMLLLVSACLLTCGCSQQKTESLNVFSAISTARELTTLKYEYMDFGTYQKDAETVSLPIIGEKEIPLTKDEFIFTYGGTICIGFHLEDIVPVVDENTKTITVKIPEPVILSHTPNHEAEKTYVIKNSVMTSTNEAIDAYEEAKNELQKAKEEALMQDESIKEEAIQEYKDMCQAWLLNADSAASEYTIKYE